MLNIGLRSKERSIRGSALSQGWLNLTRYPQPVAELRDPLLQITLLLSQDRSIQAVHGGERQDQNPKRLSGASAPPKQRSPRQRWHTDCAHH